MRWSKHGRGIILLTKIISKCSSGWIGASGKAVAPSPAFNNMIGGRMPLTTDFQGPHVTQRKPW
jgi:hypothetical protein